MVECGGLESHCALLGTGGSNPLPSAIKKRNLLLTQRVFLWLANCKHHNWRCLCYAKIQRKIFPCIFARKSTEGRGILRPSHEARALFSSPILMFGTIPPPFFLTL